MSNHHEHLNLTEASIQLMICLPSWAVNESPKQLQELAASAAKLFSRQKKKRVLVQVFMPVSRNTKSDSKQSQQFSQPIFIQHLHVMINPALRIIWFAKLYRRSILTNLIFGCSSFLAFPYLFRENFDGQRQAAQVRPPMLNQVVVLFPKTKKSAVAYCCKVFSLSNVI